jgi:putative NADH-flavin reductase
MMNVLVFGATGPLGRRVVDRLLAAGHHVTIFVRSPGRLAARAGLREVTGDVLDASAVAAAVPGHDAVISALGHSRPSPAGPDLHPGASHIIEAMQAAGVTRLIWISSHGVGDSRGHSGFVFERIFVPLRLRAEFADKERQEALVTASDLDWTIVRPARLTNGPATGRVRAQPRLRISIRDSVSRADVAEFVLAELERGDQLLSAPTLAAT